jgi:hypothetical protein
MSAKRRMPDSPKRIGDAADHGRSESKEYVAGMLRKARYETGHRKMMRILLRPAVRSEMDRNATIGDRCRFKTRF